MQSDRQKLYLGPVTIPEKKTFEKFKFIAATSGLMVSLLGLGMYFTSINKVMRQIKAKQRANALVESLKKELSQPQGCTSFLGTNFQLAKEAKDFLKSPTGDIDENGGQILTSFVIAGQQRTPGQILENYDLIIENIKLYTVPSSRTLADENGANTYQLVATFAPTKPSLEPTLHPIILGELSLSQGQSQEACLWKEPQKEKGL